MDHRQLPDDDRTLMPEDRLASSPGTAYPSAGAMRYEHALPIGTRLHEFELIDVVGEGGFSIVYLAHDHSLDRRVQR